MKQQSIHGLELKASMYGIPLKQLTVDEDMLKLKELSLGRIGLYNGFSMVA